MTSPAEQPEKKPVKKRFRWRRLAAWFSGSALFIVLLLAAAVWWLWTYRVDYINRSLAAMHGKIKNLTLSRDSAVIHDFEFRDDKTNELLLRLPEVVIKASATDLQQRHINLVTLNDAQIDISDSTLKKLLGPGVSSDSSGAILLPG